MPVWQVAKKGLGGSEMLEAIITVLDKEQNQITSPHGHWSLDYDRKNDNVPDNVCVKCVGGVFVVDLGQVANLSGIDTFAVTTLLVAGDAKGEYSLKVVVRNRHTSKVILEKQTDHIVNADDVTSTWRIRYVD